MGSTTRKTQVAGQKPVSAIKPNTTAGAVIPLKKYLEKYALAPSTSPPVSADKLIPPSGTTLPPNVKSTHVPISLWPLTNNGLSSFYAGVFDDEMHFSASVLKVAALFAAGQFHAEATAFAQGYTDWNKFVTDFNADLKTRINPTTVDSHILSAGFFLLPQTQTILKQSAFPTIAFADNAGGFQERAGRMIVESDDPSAAICIRALGYGYINMALRQANFYSSFTSPGIWLAGTYDKADKLKKVRIPCVNDHPDAQVTTSRLMCLMTAMIRLGQLPQNDAGANALMQGWLHEPKSGPDATGPWLGAGRDNTIAPKFTIVHDKIGFAGLGDDEVPNVYSEALIIKWTTAAQLAAFNKTIDPTDTHPEIHLSEEIAVCWQNYLWPLMPSPRNFDGIIDVINNSISDFLQQTPT
ncbi:MAG: hypothetical protein LAO55_26385 [Acidobacteriia bacterium]|nr:hypothetical protein [Terriglobia bacterium]